MLPGFFDPALSAHSVFRSVMDALARPSRVVRLDVQVSAPAPLMNATAAISLSLFDHDSPVWVDVESEAANAWLRFHTSAPIVTNPAQCLFAIITDCRHLPRFERFNLGSDEYPDRSTTAIVQVQALTGGRAVRFSGPGIRDQNTIYPAGLPDDFPLRFFANRALFPRGIDLLLVSGSEVVALPRSLRVVPEA